MDPHRPAVTFLLLCGSNHCEAFEEELRTRRFANAVVHVESGAELVERLTDMATGTPAVVLIDTASPDAWGAIRTLKQPALRHVPVVALCEDDRAGEAYTQLVNAVVPWERWAKGLDEVTRKLGAFWIHLVRVPPVKP